MRRAGVHKDAGPLKRWMSAGAVLMASLGLLVEAEAADPNVCFAVSDGTDQLVTIDRSGSPTTLIGATGRSNIEGITLSLDANTLYAANQNGSTGEFGTVNQATGVFSPIGSIGTGNGALGSITFADVDGLAVDPRTGVIYGSVRRAASTTQLDVLIQIDPVTGAFVPDAFGPNLDYVPINTGSTVGLYDVDDIAIDPADGQMYAVANNAGGNDRLVRVDKSTGAVTDVGLLRLADGTPVTDMEGFSFSNDGVFYGTTGTNSTLTNQRNRFWQVDKATGVVTLQGAFSTGSDYEGVACLTAGSNTIEGTVFVDLDEDGVNDSEPGQGGVAVRLYIDENNDGQVDAGDTLIDTTATAGDGSYSFELAVLGNYVIDIDTATLPAGTTLTTDNVEEATFTTFGNTDANNDFGIKLPPLLAVEKTANTAGPVGPGDTVTYTVVVTNNDTGSATEVTLGDILPSDVTYLAQSTVATWPVVVSAPGNYLDQFTEQSYSNSHGSVLWSGPWVETEDDGGGATGGEIQITTAGRLQLQDLDTNGGDPDNGVERPVDLSVADTSQPVTLTWDWFRVDGNESVRVQLLVSDTWVEVDSTGTGGSAGSESHSLTAVQIASTTAIRFVSDSGGWGGNERIDIDNVQFAFTTQMTTLATRDNVPGGANPDLSNGVPPNLVTATDSVRLQAGETVTVTYQVTVDELFNGTVELTNIATANSNEIGPESDSVALSIADYGDGPVADYGNVSHIIAPGIYLGAGVDGDSSDFDSPAADGDDGSGSNDEDGVTFHSPAGGVRAELYADVSVVNDTGGDAYVCAWLDRWDAGGSGDGSFDASDGQDAGPLCQPVADNNGTPTTATFYWSGMPEVAGSTYARFRVCTTLAECNVPASQASAGEVEDYLINFDFTPTAVTIGAVGLVAEPVGDVLRGLGGEEASLEAMLEMLQGFDPQLAEALTNAPEGQVEAALIDYLDPDGDGHVAVLRWETLQERGTIGFYVERSEDGIGDWQRINDAMLPGLIDAPLGGEYWLVDPDALPGRTYEYRLIELEAWGTQRNYGPWGLRLPN